MPISMLAVLLRVREHIRIPMAGACFLEKVHDALEELNGLG